MLKIVEVHAGKGVRGEYVVLQNFGLIAINLRGWALCTDAYLEGDAVNIAFQMYVFRDDIAISPYTRVVLFTSSGNNGWMPTVDGHQAYCAYWNREEPIWSHAEHIYVLQMSGSRRIQAIEHRSALAV